MTDKLANFPYVRVRVRCTRCRRYGDLSLARLAAKLGAECSLWGVMEHLTSNCARRRRKYGRLYAPCYAQFVDLTAEDLRHPDMPPGYYHEPPCAKERGERSLPDVRTRRSNSSS